MSLLNKQKRPSAGKHGPERTVTGYHFHYHRVKILSIYSYFVFTFIIIPWPVAGESANRTEISSAPPKYRNVDLLLHKMYDDQVPVFERAAGPNADYLVLSRMQRHAASRQKRRHQRLMATIDNGHDDDDQTIIAEMDHSNDDDGTGRGMVIRKRPRNRKPIPASVARQAFDSLRSSVVIPSLGTLPPRLAKRRHGFCKAIPFQQKISQHGCKSRIIKNNYCFGNCNSFYIPADSNRTMPFSSCTNCTPRRYRWTIIRLKCPYYDNDDNDHQPPPPPPIESPRLKSSDDNLVLDTAEDDQTADSQLPPPPPPPPQRRPRFKKRGYRYKKVQIISKCRCQPT